ncbi:MAG TPA: hypothetical protein VFH47_09005 [Candidatus Thermoplasmatota archaeon]|nr:hypothetical protein [Candidatus Thermoplasmatota archaeon]
MKRQPFGRTMDYHRVLQQQVEELVRESRRPVPRHTVPERLRQAGRTAPPELVAGAVARLLARGRLTEGPQGLVASPVSPPLIVR